MASVRRLLPYRAFDERAPIVPRATAVCEFDHGRIIRHRVMLPGCSKNRSLRHASGPEGRRSIAWAAGPGGRCLVIWHAPCRGARTMRSNRLFANRPHMFVIARSSNARHDGSTPRSPNAARCTSRPLVASSATARSCSTRATAPCHIRRTRPGARSRRASGGGVWPGPTGQGPPRVRAAELRRSDGEGADVWGPHVRPQFRVVPNGNGGQPYSPKDHWLCRVSLASSRVLGSAPFPPPLRGYAQPLISRHPGLAARATRRGRCRGRVWAPKFKRVLAGGFAGVLGR